MPEDERTARDGAVNPFVGYRERLGAFGSLGLMVRPFGTGHETVAHYDVAIVLERCGRTVHSDAPDGAVSPFHRVFAVLKHEGETFSPLRAVLYLESYFHCSLDLFETYCESSARCHCDIDAVGGGDFNCLDIVCLRVVSEMCVGSVGVDGGFVASALKEVQRHAE